MPQGERRETSQGERQMRTIGNFQIDDNGIITGPKAYMASENYRETKARLERGDSAIIMAAPNGSDILALIGVVFQTDYAAWLGMERTRKEMGVA